MIVRRRGDPRLGQLFCSGTLSPNLPADEWLHRQSAPAVVVAKARERIGEISPVARLQTIPKPRTLRTADTSDLKIATEKWNSESRMRENRLSGLMRGREPGGHWCKSSHSVGSCLLYTPMVLFDSGARRDAYGVATDFSNSPWRSLSSV
jgi:hypothetical protein